MSVGIVVPMSLLILAITSSKFDPNSSNDLSNGFIISAMSKFDPNSANDLLNGFIISAISRFDGLIVDEPPPLTEVLMSFDILPRSKLIGGEALCLGNTFARPLSAFSAPMSVMPLAIFICCSGFSTTSPGLVISKIDPTASLVIPSP